MGTESSARIRVLAFIERRFGLADGFFCDVSFEIDPGQDPKLVQRILLFCNDGALYKKFEDAQKAVLRETGILMELLPENEWTVLSSGNRWQVSHYVREFEATNKARRAIEEESPLMKIYFGTTPSGNQEGT